MKNLLIVKKKCSCNDKNPKRRNSSFDALKTEKNAESSDNSYNNLKKNFTQMPSRFSIPSFKSNMMLETNSFMTNSIANTATFAENNYATQDFNATGDYYNFNHIHESDFENPPKIVKRKTKKKPKKDNSKNYTSLLVKYIDNQLANIDHESMALVDSIIKRKTKSPKTSKKNLQKIDDSTLKKSIQSDYFSIKKLFTLKQANGEVVQ